MFSNFIKYLYYLIFSILIFLVLSSYIFRNLYLDTNFIFLYSLFIIPIIDLFIEKVKNSIKFLLFLSIIVFSYIFIFSISGYKEISNTILNYSYILLITGAITQYVSFIIEGKNSKISKENLLKKKNKGLGDYFHILYIGVGILFILGLFIEIIKFVFNDYHFGKLAGIFLLLTIIIVSIKKVKFKTEEKVKNKLNDLNKRNFLKFRKKINNNKLFKVLTGLNIKTDIIFYLIFIFFTFIFILGYIYNITSLVAFSYLLIFTNYIIFKIYGFNVDTSFERLDFKSNKFLSFAIIFTIIFSFSVTNIIKGYNLNGYKGILIGVSSLLFFFTFLIYFSDIKTRNKKETNFKKLFKVIPKIIFAIVLITFIYIGKNLYFDYNSKYIQQESYKNKEAVSYETEKDTSKTEKIYSSGSANGENEEEIEDEKKITKKVKIGDLYKFNNYLGIENESEDTLKLQEFLLKLGYFKGEVNGKFGIYTRNALKYALIYDCHWPNALGVLGSDAAKCIESLEIEVEVNE
ncbi:hypothetical protein CSB08_01255 [Candidatus Gracilibacteria bacterium]|nr:MAG: hypothetical protein CSB08_01255 [Candidatus Gracilibacteria bacterium]PIE85402.1 MAG: hypothetical protein CSA08_02390 [Candidatus Gracilibacteria bacterium]